MKKKSTLLYIIIFGVLLLGAALGIIVNLLMGHTLADMFASKFALTVYIAIGGFAVIFAVLALIDWGRK
jgi:hypothetical protein